jgi:predicted ATP-grasp superfamily ATP-dependent carboligase
LPRSSPAEPASLLVAAISARALAQAARRAGFAPLAVDFFADLDTQAAAHAWRKLRGLKRGFQADSLLRALEDLAARASSPVLGCVYGAGFEDRPELLGLIAERWPLLGNDARTVRRVKAPDVFFPALERLGIPHPRTALALPAKSPGWLAKKIGGAGGSHVLPSRRARRSRGLYYQERIEGRSVSALFVANGQKARVLGFSEQWTASAARTLWRYGGALRPALLPPPVARAMTFAVEAITPVFNLVGLASADFIVNGSEAWLLEINPRPGATLDIFDRSATSLLRLHLDAIHAGKLPRSGLKFDDAMASAIVYAPHGTTVPAGTLWPDWVADRPKPSEWIDKNRPICTVWARASTRVRTKRLIEERICKVQAGLQNVVRGDDGEQKRRNRRRAEGRAAKHQRQDGAAGSGAYR